WVLDNIPPNSKIAQEWYGALLNGTPYALFVPPEISLPADRTLAQYYEDGFRYFIISSRVYGRYQNEPTRYTSELNFYQSLAEHGTLLQQFEPSTIRGGPVIKIYALASPPPTP
ncbi:MAG: hypothetical protein KC413_20200, partial [Anaerolineales bacterium]|nr:hypothetical protein [Anaerolineales bacterium]